MNRGLKCYRFTVEALEDTDLPEYLGSTLRGGFGHLFRKIACPASHLRGSRCPIPEQCPYHLIFEPSPPPDATALRNLEEIPRPFVLTPPLASERFYPAGTTFSFDLTLIGKAIPFLPYLIFGRWTHVGKNATFGLGRCEVRVC